MVGKIAVSCYLMLWQIQYMMTVITEPEMVKILLTHISKESNNNHSALITVESFPKQVSSSSLRVLVVHCSISSLFFFFFLCMFWRSRVCLQPLREGRSVRDPPKIWEKLLTFPGETKTKTMQMLPGQNISHTSHNPTRAESKYIVPSHTTVCAGTIKSLFLISDRQLDSSVYDYCVLSAASLQQRTNISYKGDYIDREVWICVCVCADRYFIWSGLHRKRLSSTHLPAGCLL